MLLRSVAPWLDRLDATVRQIRQARGRRVVIVTTFASFATLWLIPRLIDFQKLHPDIDIRVSASELRSWPTSPAEWKVEPLVRSARSTRTTSSQPSRVSQERMEQPPTPPPSTTARAPATAAGA
jgi:LysR family glycine cleavage system transcriptional activator